LREVADILRAPLNLNFLQSKQEKNIGSALVIKEMPYQIGANFSLLAGWAKPPIIFLIRDPRLNIASRIEKKIETGDSSEFPLIETGWDLILEQISYCRAQDIPHLIVDTTDFRKNPQHIFPQIFERLGLPFSDDMLQWQPCPDVDLDNLGECLL